jgi:hypothetical protein
VLFVRLKRRFWEGVSSPFADRTGRHFCGTDKNNRLSAALPRELTTIPAVAVRITWGPGTTEPSNDDAIAAWRAMLDGTAPINDKDAARDGLVTRYQHGRASFLEAALRQAARILILSHVSATAL